VYSVLRFQTGTDSYYRRREQCPQYGLEKDDVVVATKKQAEECESRAQAAEELKSAQEQREAAMIGLADVQKELAATQKELKKKQKEQAQRWSMDDDIFGPVNRPQPFGQPFIFAAATVTPTCSTYQPPEADKESPIRAFIGTMVRRSWISGRSKKRSKVELPLPTTAGQVIS
jgi:hypothetical protein